MFKINNYDSVFIDEYNGKPAINLGNEGKNGVK